MRLLLVEDDDGVADAVADALTAHGHRVVRVSHGADALLRHREADMILLDLGLPDGDGLAVLRKLRAISPVPVLVLTARGDERTVVRALRLGGDDYVVKPVRLAELLARISAVARRFVNRASAEPPRPSDLVRVGDVEISLTARRVRVDGHEVSLTAKEFAILAVLAGKCGTAVSRQVVMDEVWGDAFVAVSRALDVHLTSLRAKLDRPGLVSTIRGFGYRLGP